MDYICGKRLQPMLPEPLTVLERHNEFSCDRETRAKLLRISAASIDRLLRTERRKYELLGVRARSPDKFFRQYFGRGRGNSESCNGPTGRTPSELCDLLRDVRRNLRLKSGQPFTYFREDAK